MAFWTALKATYSGSSAFLIACPLLALIPVAFELLQHAVEAHIGCMAVSPQPRRSIITRCGWRSAWSRSPR